MLLHDTFRGRLVDRQEGAGAKVEIVKASQPLLPLETRVVGQTRLRAVGLLFTGLGSAMFVRSIIIGDHSLLVWHLALLMLLSAATILLFARVRLGVAGMRRFEILIFGSCLMFMCGKFTVEVMEAVEAQDELALGTVITRCLFFYVLFMLIYATFIPNSWRRAALFVIPTAMAPIVITTILRHHYSPVDLLLRRVTDLDNTSFNVLVLAGGAAISIFGAHVIHTLRITAVEAQEFGQYRLVEKLATGGMGEVWRAQHSLLRRPAAIKLIRPEVVVQVPIAPQTLFARFELEAQATAELLSPHTVSVYDFGVLADGALYYVMELLQGMSLEKLVQQYGPMPPERVVYLLLQTCDSLAEAHANGLVHRDIKPSNIMTCKCGLQCDFVKVLDFGVARRISPQDEARLTLPGMTTGTPAFMAPEIGLGQSDVDHRADIYSLGCVAYFLLTGMLVFNAETAMGIVTQHVTRRPDRPSRWAELHIPEVLEEAIMSCLEKRPDDRPSSALELKARLQTCPALKLWDDRRAHEWWDTHGLLA